MLKNDARARCPLIDGSLVGWRSIQVVPLSLGLLVLVPLSSVLTGFIGLGLVVTDIAVLHHVLSDLVLALSHQPIRKEGSRSRLVTIHLLEGASRGRETVEPSRYYL